jgi:23S rRNA (uracil-5-)-methyltransferase RumA
MATPLCSYFGNCGGCSLQHIDYNQQLENKKLFLQKSINFEDVQAFSDKEYYYRNRMDLIFTKGGVGFRQKNNWANIVDIEKCVIAGETINKLITEIRTFFKDSDYFDIKRKTGTFRFAVIRTPSDDSSISFVLNENSTRLADAVEKIKEFSKTTSSNDVLITYVPSHTDESTSSEFFVVKGKDMLSEGLLGRSFSYSSQGFFQNNTLMAEKMQKYTNELLQKYDDTKRSFLLDLYGGVGTFGIINAELFKEVTIVESFKGCVDSAELNIKQNSVSNVKSIVLDAEKLKKLTLRTPLFVITDPPRSGMGQKAIDELNRIKPLVIIYVSCNITELAKELHKFKNYRIKSAALFDLFPQTNHCETIVELVLN